MKSYPVIVDGSGSGTGCWVLDTLLNRAEAKSNQEGPAKSASLCVLKIVNSHSRLGTITRRDPHSGFLVSSWGTAMELSISWALERGVYLVDEKSFDTVSDESR